MSLKFGIVKELNQELDRRVAFSPTQLEELKLLYPQLEFRVESSDNRIFTDEEYESKGITVSSDITDCDVLIGINPIAPSNLILGKEYLFVTDLIKKGNPLFTLDALTSLVGTYNAFRAFGLKFELFKLPVIATFSDQTSLITYLKRPVLPPLKITFIGSEANLDGAEVIMKALKIKKVSSDDFLSKNFAQAVYTFIDSPEQINLESFTTVSDICIINSSINGKSVLVSQELLNTKDGKLRVVADLNPMSTNSIACTLRQSTPEDPFYGYLPNENKEVDLHHPGAIVVVAVPDTTIEYPKETSEFFGNQLAQYYIPTVFK
jgi:Alanine dehydrogenase/PNT, N-terminal domain